MKRVYGKKIRKMYSLTIFSVFSMCAFMIVACGKVELNDQEISKNEDMTVDESENEYNESESEKKEESETDEMTQGMKILDPAKAQEALQQISNELGSYIETVLMTEWTENSASIPDGIDITLTDAEKIRAAALACDADGVIDSHFVEGSKGIVIDESAEIGPYGNGYHGWSVSVKEVETKCRDLFGTEAVLDALQTKVQNGSFDAVRYSGSNEKYVILLSNEIETDSSFEIHECRINSDNSEYSGQVDIYWGHWGKLQDNPDLSNYTATFQFARDENSRYGMTVLSINIRKIDETEGIEDSVAMTEKNIGQNEGFIPALISEEPEDVSRRITAEQALVAVENYCYLQDPSLKDIVNDGGYTVYWDVQSETEKEIVVLFRSYTGALIRYYIDPAVGSTYVTQFVSGITDGEERSGEIFDIREYMD